MYTTHYTLHTLHTTHYTPPHYTPNCYNCHTTHYTPSTLQKYTHHTHTTLHTATHTSTPHYTLWKVASKTYKDTDNFLVTVGGVLANNRLT
jgi:hypothetical protein